MSESSDNHPMFYRNHPTIQTPSSMDDSSDNRPAIPAIHPTWLVLLDVGWSKENIEKIFPQNDSDRPYWNAAWGTYLSFCQPYDNVFEVIKDQYSFAINLIGSTSKDIRKSDNPDNHLAEHLMTYYWRGKVDLDSSGEIMKRFWDKADDELKGHVISFIGESLYRTHGNISSKIIVRLVKLWNWRFEIFKSSPSSDNFKNEIGGFGWWFASGKFDDIWAIDQFLKALKISGKAEPDHLIMEKLATLAEKIPDKTVQCISEMIKADKEGWKIYHWRDQIRNIITLVFKSTDTQARDNAEDLIHELGARGHFEFRELLPIIS